MLFLGVTDDGRVSGLPVTDELLKALADLRDQGNILPPPSTAVRKLETADGPVAVVEVAPSMAPPVRFKGRIYIRVGPRRSIASLDDERRLNERRRALDLPFDARPLSGSTVEDLDLSLFTGTLLPSLQPAEVLAENHRSSAQRLAALRLLTADGSATAAGVLVAGKDPLEWLPGAYVQFLRVDGTDLTDPVKDEKRLDGPLLDVLRQLDELLALNISTAVDLTSENREIRSPDYPLAALQQVARNAIMHRSYENTNAPVRVTWFADRVELVNPGGPYGVSRSTTSGRALRTTATRQSPRSCVDSATSSGSVRAYPSPRRA